MDFRELLKFIDTEDQRLKDRYNISDAEKQVLARAVKLAEEVGEFSQEILARSSLQRKEKMANHDSSRVGEEFADVIITAMLVAKSLGIDMEKALKDKMEKIDRRG